jgi:hypothetical protein
MYVPKRRGLIVNFDCAAAHSLMQPMHTAAVVGPLMSQVWQTWASGNGLHQRYRISLASPAVEVYHASGTLPSSRELISRISTDLLTNSHVHTDSTGFYELKGRPLNLTGPISQNYHALVQTAALIEKGGSAGREMAVLTRRTMGVASLTDGEMEYVEPASVDCHMQCT